METESRSRETSNQSVPRLFRPASDFLAIRPEAIDFSWLFFAGRRHTEHTPDGIAIVHILGPLDHHDTGWFDSYEAIWNRVELAISGMDVVNEAMMRRRWDDSVIVPEPVPAKALVLCIDSPGGEAAGASQLHRKIRGIKLPKYAYANETACSAAYEIASSCDEVWLSDCASLGSIGVIATLFDRTVQNAMVGLGIELITSGAYKADGHPDRPITKGVRARTQSRVDQLAGIFFELVADARGTTPEAIEALQAGVFEGDLAVKVGIADGVSDYDAFLDLVSKSLTAESSSEEAA